MTDKILPHELQFLIEHNLKLACEAGATEDKIKHTMRAMQLMQIVHKQEKQ